MDFDTFMHQIMFGPAPEAVAPVPVAAAPALPLPTANAEAAFALLCSNKPLTTIEAMLVAQAAMATA